MKLLGSVTFADGVRVAVQVLPPSALARLDRVPLATLSSERSKLLTFSLKVKVTTVVWAGGQVRVGDADGRRWPIGIERVVVGNRDARPGIAGGIADQAGVQHDQVGGIGDGSRRGQGCGPGLAAVGAGQVGQGAVGHTQLGQVKPVTTSLKAMVTVVVWPMPRLLFATEMVAVGRWVSTL